MKRATFVATTVSSATMALIWSVCPSIGADQDDLRARFRLYDSDGSGQVTAAELTDPRVFALLDGDRDGAITLQEAKAAVAAGRLRGVKLPAPVPANQRPSSESPSESASESTARSERKQADEAGLNDDVRQGPKPVKPSESGVGRMLADLEFTDIDGAAHRFSDFGKSRALVIAMTGTGCPLCLKYAPTLAALEDRYRDRDVAFIFVNPNESESLDRLRDAIQAQGFDGPYVRDLEERITRLLDVRTTTEVFVLDAARTLCYRGAVDDQYGFGYALDSPRHTYLIDALEAVVRGEKPTLAATTAPGCEMYYRDDSPLAGVDTDTSPTYHNRISRILLDNCVDCHREGGSAPFALETYDAVIDYAEMIGSVVRRRIMPPWFAAPNDSPDAGLAIHWANDRSLADQDRDDLLTWIDRGVAEGNPADAPLARQYPTEWEIGEPDLLLQIPKPFAVKADGQMPYQHARVETGLTEDRWIQGVEIRPTDPSVVHHVLVFVLGGEHGSEEKIDEEAGFLAAYVPGNTFQVYPEGFAKKLPAGSRLVFQLHYTPNGTATSDQTRLGIVFSDKPPQHMIRNTGISNHRIAIPPQASNHLETAALDVPADVRLLAFMPHMHLRGKAFRFDLVLPDGRRELLLDVPRYDFNWQLEYRLSEPLEVTRGSRIELAGWYDNSDQNPANPDPNETVRWGPQTEDEMMLGYVEYVLRHETLE